MLPKRPTEVRSGCLRDSSVFLKYLQFEIVIFVRDKEPFSIQIQQGLKKGDEHLLRSDPTLFLHRY